MDSQEIDPANAVAPANPMPEIAELSEAERLIQEAISLFQTEGIHSRLAAILQALTADKEKWLENLSEFLATIDPQQFGEYTAAFREGMAKVARARRLLEPKLTRNSALVQFDAVIIKLLALRSQVASGSADQQIPQALGISFDDLMASAGKLENVLGSQVSCSAAASLPTPTNQAPDGATTVDTPASPETTLEHSSAISLALVEAAQARIEEAHMLRQLADAPLSDSIQGGTDRVNSGLVTAELIIIALAQIGETTPEKLVRSLTNPQRAAVMTCLMCGYRIGREQAELGVHDALRLIATGRDSTNVSAETPAREASPDGMSVGKVLAKFVARISIRRLKTVDVIFAIEDLVGEFKAAVFEQEGTIDLDAELFQEVRERIARMAAASGMEPVAFVTIPTTMINVGKEALVVLIADQHSTGRSTARQILEAVIASYAGCAPASSPPNSAHEAATTQTQTLPTAALAAALLSPDDPILDAPGNTTDSQT